MQTLSQRSIVHPVTNADLTVCTCSAYHAPLCAKRRERGLCCVNQIQPTNEKRPGFSSYAAAATARQDGQRIVSISGGLHSGGPKRFALVPAL